MIVKLLSTNDIKSEDVSNFYHSSNWIEAIEESYDVKSFIIGLMDNKKIINVIVAHIITNFPSKVFFSLHSPPLSWATSIMRYRCNILYHINFQTNDLQCTNCRLSPSTRSLHVNIHLA